jgi:hypothetical protein
MNEYNTSGDGVAVTPSDTVGYGTDARALYVGGAGNVTLLTSAGTVLLFQNVPAGSQIPMRHGRVNATGTTATNMVALF